MTGIKIDIFLKQNNGCFKYYCSTNMHTTCKEAKKRFISLHSGYNIDQVKCSKSIRN